MTSPDAFYVPEGDGRYRATAHTQGPWAEGAQHGGPPSALLGQVMDGLHPGDGKRVARITLEILGPVPVGVVHASAEVRRPGRRVELVEGVLRDEAGREVVLARAWRLRTAAVAVPDLVAPSPSPPGPPAEGRGSGMAGLPWDVGYHTAMDLRVTVGGAFDELGPATGWMRMRQPLVSGEPTSPLARVLCTADSGNGLSTSLPIDRYVFVNSELTVHLHRYPQGEWIAMEARTTAAADGIGLAVTTISDQRSVIGHGAQSLLIDAR